MDWPTAEASLSKSRGLAVAEQLRALGGLADSSSRSSQVLRTTERGPLPFWVWAIAGLAQAQLVGGLLGFALSRPDAGGVPSGLLAAVALTFGGVGTALLLGSAGDRRTAYLGLFLLVCASAPAHRLFLWITPLPPILTWFFVLRLALPEAFMPLVLWLFVREFPRVLHLSPLEGALNLGVRASVFTGAMSFLANLAGTLARPSAPETAPFVGWLTRTHHSGSYWAGSFVLILAALVMALRRSREAPDEERRRVFFLLAGLALGITPTALVVVLDAFLPAFHRVLDTPGGLLLASTVAYAFILTVPFTAAYSVRAHRVLEVRFVLRRAAQRILARSTLTIALLLPSAALMAHLYRHRDESLDALLTGGRGAWLMALLVGASLLLAARRRLVALIDRAFFKTDADLREALTRATPRLHGSATADEAIDHLVAEVLRALRVESAAYLVRSADAAVFQPIRGSARVLALESALLAVLSEDAAPLVTEPDAPESLFPWLPEAERQWLVDGGVSLLAPLRSSAGDLVAILALGPKRSDTTFADEELVFLETLCTTASLALENRSLMGREARGAEAGDESPAGECLTCGTVTSRAGDPCACGRPTTGTPVPITLNGKFRLLRFLGRGGMGIVYLAEDLELGRQVALKTLPRLSAELSLRLRREARSMAAVTHPNLALIFGAETWRGTPILVLEYLAGGTLTQRPGPHDPWDILAMGVALARALQAMHARGLLHRDVKPSNIGFTSEGVPKLLDFGLARLLGESGPQMQLAPFASGRDSQDLTRTDHIVGTPLYLAPETIGGHKPAASQDLWALAMVLYEAIAGEHPLRTASGLDPNAIGKELPDIRSYREDCPQPVAAFLGRALHPDPARRPQTAGDVEATLAGLVAGATPHGLAEPLPGPAGSSGRSNRARSSFRSI